MLQLPALKQYDDWATVYADSDDEAMFYAIPNLPRLRWIDDNTPAFTFLKFSEPVHSGGDDPNQDNLGGGYVQFDCELSLTPDQAKAVTDDMQSALDKSRRARGLNTIPVNIAPPTWHDSDKVSVMLITFPPKPDGSGFVTNILSGGKPSMLGSNIATFAMELTQHGATLLWDAFQMAVSPISVVYRLEVMAQIPTVSMHVWLHADQVHHFTEQINKDIDSSVWGDDDQKYSDNTREIFSKYAVGGVDVTGFDPGSGSSSTDDFAKVKKDMEEQGWAMMEQTLQDDMKDRFSATPATAKGAQGDFKNTCRDYLEAFSQDLDVYFKDKDVIPWPMNPQGSLQGILTQPHNGKIPNKANFFKEISLDDDFFKLLQLRIHCNCDFDADPIDSVIVHVIYGSNVADFRLTKAQPDTTFRSFIDKSLGKNWNYSYTVNYKGTDKTLKSGPLKGSGDALVINVADMGYLKLQVTASAFNWDFIDSAQVRIKYSDAANGVAEQQDVLAFNAKAPVQPYSRMIYAPVTQPYQYAVDLFLKNGQRTSGDFQSSTATSLTIKDVFASRLAVTVLPAGNFDQLSHIVVDLSYNDPAHQYSQQITAQLNTVNDSQVWIVPVWPGGPDSYSYRTLVAYKDGHSTQSDWIPRRGSGSFNVGDVFAKTINATFRTDLIDWTKVRLAMVKIHYADAANNISQLDDLVFTSAKQAPQTWSLPIKDASKTSFDYTTVFYNIDSTQTTVPAISTSDDTILLDTTAATAAAGGAH
jgi:hypothetical protein